MCCCIAGVAVVSVVAWQVYDPFKVDVQHQNLRASMFDITHEWSDLCCIMKNKQNVSIKPTVHSFFVGEGMADPFAYLTKAGLTASSINTEKSNEEVNKEKSIGTNTSVLHSAFKQKQEKMKEAREKSAAAAPKAPPSTPFTIAIPPAAKKQRNTEKKVDKSQSK